MSDTTIRPPARPSVMSLAIKERAALYAAFMPFLRNGGLFIPTNRPYKVGDDMYLILTLMDDPAKYPIAGKVVWITPSGAPTGKPQGVGIQFPTDDSGITLRRKIEEVLGGAVRSTRQTHTM